MSFVLGIDTSNYTTAAAIVSEQGTLLAEARQLLPVGKGQRGLRQSDALFFHVQQWQEVFSRLLQQCPRDFRFAESLAAIAVSVRPRPMASSYMPVFSAGRTFAYTLAQGLSIPVVHTSHQEGHLAAGDEEDLTGEWFVAVHISGGTSDVMLARRTAQGYAIELVGEGSDLHAGQFVDRVGVAMGLPFPAGRELELMGRLAPDNLEFRLSSSVRGAQMSFAGPCSAALRALDRNVPREHVARAVELSIANAVVKAVDAAVAMAEDSGRKIRRALIVGGVASNSVIHQRIVHRLSILRPRINIHFASPEFSRDNAYGVARIGARFLTKKTYRTSGTL